MITPLLLCLAGAIWALGFHWASHWKWQLKIGLILAIILGGALRVWAFALPAYEEIDFYRYFWDAKQFLARLNPYAHPISDLLHPHPPELYALQARHPDIIQGIRQDTHLLSTIYAPVAISLFGVVDALPGPTDLGFVLTFVLAEAATLVLLFLWGTSQDVRLGIWAIALNPLLILVSYNGLHFDLWLLPLLVGWILALRSGRVRLALVFLVAAIALRHWPILLLPISLMAFPTWRQRIATGIMVSIGLVLIFLPQILQYNSFHSGLRQYGATWEMNDSLFIGLKLLLGEPMARLCSLCLPLIVSIGLALFRRGQDPALSGVLIMGTLLLFSPTFFPWYWLWILPFLILARTPLAKGGAAMAAVLPLYYIRFWLEDRGHQDIFDQTLVWIEFGPIFALLMLLAWQHVYRSHNSRT